MEEQHESEVSASAGGGCGPCGAGGTKAFQPRPQEEDEGAGPQAEDPVRRSEGCEGESGEALEGEAAQAPWQVPVHYRKTPLRLNRGVHANGYRFGGGGFAQGPTLKGPHTEDPPAEPGVSIATHGYECLDRDGSFVSWHEDIVAALVAAKERGNTKIVRCSDRALMTWTNGPRWKDEKR